MPLIILAAIFLAGRLCCGVESASAEQTASFEISPHGPHLTPGASAILTLRIDASRQPLANEWVTVRLDAPSSRRFFSTDFPAVEGTRLVEVRLPILDGKAQWRQVFPIRGEYRLTASFADAAGVNAERTFAFHVYETRQKWLLLAGVALALFFIGAIAGRIFSAPRNAKRTKLGLGFVLCLGYCGAALAGSSAQENHRRTYGASLEVSPATVGRPARVHWWLRPGGMGGKLSAKLSFSITHVEKDAAVFALEKIPVAGEFLLDYQFTDGSDYRVSAIAVLDTGEIVRQDQIVSVNAVAPPWRAQLPALAFFLLLIFLGLLVGRWSRFGKAN